METRKVQTGTPTSGPQRSLPSMHEPQPAPCPAGATGYPGARSLAAGDIWSLQRLSGNASVARLIASRDAGQGRAIAAPPRPAAPVVQREVPDKTDTVRAEAEAVADALAGLVDDLEGEASGAARDKIPGIVGPLLERIHPQLEGAGEVLERVNTWAGRAKTRRRPRGGVSGISRVRLRDVGDLERLGARHSRGRRRAGGPHRGGDHGA